jgi:arginine/lysine/ornithine decarboxylase
MSNILAVCSVGDTPAHTEALVNALADIALRYRRDSMLPVPYEYEKPVIRMSPRKAFFAKKKTVPLTQAVGRIAGSAVMCYPPGIPLLAPGELITREIAEHIVYAEQKRCQIQGITKDGVQVVE